MIQQYHSCIYIYVCVCVCVCVCIYIYIYPKEMKPGILKRYLYTHIHSSVTHDSEKVKAT